jgi:hypothetical protein
MGQYTFQKLRTTIRIRLLRDENESAVAINARQKAKKNVFQRLPPELIRIILNFLSDVDEICFALSNIAIYTYFRENAKTIVQLVMNTVILLLLSPLGRCERGLQKRNITEQNAFFDLEISVRSIVDNVEIFIDAL